MTQGGLEINPPEKAARTAVENGLQSIHNADRSEGTQTEKHGPTDSREIESECGYVGYVTLIALLVAIAHVGIPGDAPCFEL